MQTATENITGCISLFKILRWVQASATADQVGERGGIEQYFLKLMLKSALSVLRKHFIGDEYACI